MTQKVKNGFTSQTVNWLSKYDILIYLINNPYLIRTTSYEILGLFIFYLYNCNLFYKLTHNLSFVIIYIYNLNILYNIIFYIL